MGAGGSLRAFLHCRPHPQPPLPSALPWAALVWRPGHWDETADFLIFPPFGEFSLSMRALGAKFLQEWTAALPPVQVAGSVPSRWGCYRRVGGLLTPAWTGLAPALASPKARLWGRPKLQVCPCPCLKAVEEVVWS